MARPSGLSGWPRPIRRLPLTRRPRSCFLSSPSITRASLQTLSSSVIVAPRKKGKSHEAHRFGNCPYVPLGCRMWWRNIGRTVCAFLKRHVECCRDRARDLISWGERGRPCRLLAGLPGTCVFFRDLSSCSRYKRGAQCPWCPRQFDRPRNRKLGDPRLECADIRRCGAFLRSRSWLHVHRSRSASHMARRARSSWRAARVSTAKWWHGGST